MTLKIRRISNKWAHNVYVGVGISRILRFQLGYGTQGQVMRLRSDFNYRVIVDFLTQTEAENHRLNTMDRPTFTLSFERYEGKDNAFNNITWRIGLLF